MLHQYHTAKHSTADEASGISVYKANKQIKFFVIELFIYLMIKVSDKEKAKKKQHEGITSPGRAVSAHPTP